jgi:hypothetical protein
MFPTFTSLAKMWNYLIINSSNEYNLIMNDDTALVDIKSLDKLKRYIHTDTTGFALTHELLFSCFLITKELLDDVGYFDERLLAIGEEDGDFLWRYQKKYSSNETYIAELGCAAWGLDSKTTHNIRPANDADDNSKSWFNSHFMDKKYKNNPNETTIGWFPEPRSPVISDEKQYPYESFKREYYSRLNG